MDNATKDVYEQQTKDFLQGELPNDMGVKVDILSVIVIKQTVVPTSASNGTRRLQEQGGLLVKMKVNGEIFPGVKPEGFSLAEIIGTVFLKKYLVFVYRLSTALPFFDQLLGNDAAALQGDTSQNDDSNGGMIAGIFIGVFAVMAIAVAAAVYAVRLRSNSDLRNRPKTIETTNQDHFKLDPTVPTNSSCMTPYDQPGSDFDGSPSPSAMESGSRNRLGIARFSSAADMMSPQTQATFGSGLLGILRPRKPSPEKEPEPMGRPSASVLSPADSQARGFGAQGRGISLKFDLSETSPTNNPIVEMILDKEVPPKDEPKNAAKEESTLGTETFHTNSPIVITKILEKKKVPRVEVENDDQKSLDDNEEYETTTEAAAERSWANCCAVPNMEGFLGARRMDQDEELQYQERKSRKAPPKGKRTGLYDVFAPSGPLGIVVDTTKDGPVVHSLKSTSPLLGLVSPGDLIVGLDDMDTRSMTAATLTRLMAKRSHQPERKVTLLALEEN